MGATAKQARITTYSTQTNVDTGVASGRYESYKFKNKIAFSYQAGLGAAYPLSDSATADLGYRYTGSSQTLVSKSKGVKIKVEPMHALSLGVRFTF